MGNSDTDAVAPCGGGWIIDGKRSIHEGGPDRHALLAELPARCPVAADSAPRGPPLLSTISILIS